MWIFEKKILITDSFVTLKKTLILKFFSALFWLRYHNDKVRDWKNQRATHNLFSNLELRRCKMTISYLYISILSASQWRVPPLFPLFFYWLITESEDSNDAAISNDYSLIHHHFRLVSIELLPIIIYYHCLPQFCSCTFISSLLLKAATLAL